MEILIGIISSGLTEIIKLLSPKFGVELTKKVVYFIVFGFCFAGTYMITAGLISLEAVKQFISIFTASYTTYNLIIKPVKNSF